MPRAALTRSTAVLAAAAATTALGVALAPAAQADGSVQGPAAGSTLLQHLRENTQSNVPNIVTTVPPFGRRLG